MVAIRRVESKRGRQGFGTRLGKSLTENSSVRPTDLRMRADNVTETANAMVPSPVF